MSTEPKTGLAELAAALRAVPRTLYRSVVRRGVTGSAKNRAQATISNFFLHIHAARTHRYSLKWNYTFGLGVMTAACLVTLLVTGLLLMIYYKPTTEHAYDSVKDIVYVVPFGRLVRNLHRWSAHLMVILVFLHMARVFFTGSYRRGRAFNWIIGVGLLVLTLALSFTGYLLPWDQLSYWAVTIGGNIAGSPSEFTDAVGMSDTWDPGATIQHLILGADDIGGDALLRFYFLHCVFLPLGLFTLLGVHIWRIRKDGGLTRPDDIAPEELPVLAADDTEAAPPAAPNVEPPLQLLGTVRGTSPAVGDAPTATVASWPYAFRSEAAAALLVTALSLVLALFFDAPLKEHANPAVPENPAKAPWYFLGLQELVGYSAFVGGLVIPVIALLGLSLVPLIDRAEGPMGRWFDDRAGRRVALSSALFTLAITCATLAFTVHFGWLRNWYPGISQLWIMLFNPGTVLLLLIAGHSLFVVRQTDSVRAGAIALFTSFLVAFIVLTYFASVHRGPNWEFYWWPSLWPGHG